MESSDPSPNFLEWCHEYVLVLLSLQNPPPLLRLLLTASNSFSRTFQTNILVYKSVPAMGYVKVDRVSESPGIFSFNSTMTLQGLIYLYFDALIPPSNLQSLFFSVYVRKASYVTQSKGRVT